MAARAGGSSSVRSLPPPCPKSPPDYPDLYGKRREAAKVQVLEREISFLEEELKSVEGLQPASRCCKEFCDGKLRSSNTNKPEESKVMSLLEVALVPISLECPALTCLGSAVVAILVTVICVTAIYATAAPLTAAHAFTAHVTAGPATAPHVTAVHATAAHLIAPHVTAVHATAAHLAAVHVNAVHVNAVHVNAALVPVVHVNAIHIAVVAHGDALALNVRRYAFAAVVQKPVVTHAAYYSNILMQFLMESSILKMSFNFRNSFYEVWN
ncbi:hypothetical protein QQP08_025631 [Theobroma cacao]|nr:hypothetical protein QQP08_025631 [Theobroma cacao]